MSLKIDSEFKNLIPLLIKEEYQQLEENLVKEGCLDALVLWGGTLIDGHNRYEICTRRKIHFDTKEHSFNSRDEVKEWIIRHQFGRRNITTAQRCDLVLKLEDVIKARAKENQLSTLKQNAVNQKSDERIKEVNTNNELAKLAGVSHNTIHQFRVVKNEGTPELQQQVLKSEISVNKAYQKIRKSKKDKIETKEIKEIKKEVPVQETSKESLPISLNHIHLLVNNFLADADRYLFMPDYTPQLSKYERQAMIREIEQINVWYQKFKSLLSEE